MGLSHALARFATRRAHVLVVETPGSWMVRARLEQEVVARGWRLGLTPADADVLAVCGTPGPDLTDVVNRLWDQMPGPRVRTDLDDATDIAQALDVVARRLADTESHRVDAAHRDHEPQATGDENSMDHGDMDHGEMNHEGMDHGEMDHGDMDHGDMEMAPDGIPLAEGENDRDGLEMDVLHLRLGPVLPHWPAGMVLSCTLSGDVISRAEGSMIDDPENGAPSASHAPNPAWRADNIARLLALAGWEDAAALARRVRDAQLTFRCSAQDDGSGRTDASFEANASPEIEASLERLRRQVTRSRLLRRSLQGLRPLTPQDLDAHDLPRHLKGDTWGRLLTMLDQAVDAVETPSDTDTTLVRARRLSPSAVAGAVVVGLDLATARLVIASLNPPPTLTPIATTHG